MLLEGSPIASGAASGDFGCANVGSVLVFVYSTSRFGIPPSYVAPGSNVALFVETAVDAGAL